MNQNFILWMAAHFNLDFKKKKKQTRNLKEKIHMKTLKNVHPPSVVHLP